MSNADDAVDEPEDLVQIHFKAPRRTKELAKAELEHGGLSRVLRSELERIAHGYAETERQRLKDELRDLRDRRSELKLRRQEIDNELEQIATKVKRLEDRLDELRDKDAEAEATIESLVDMVEEGTRIFEGHATVERAAKLSGDSQSEVIDEVRRRASDEVPDDLFHDGRDDGGGPRVF